MTPGYVCPTASGVGGDCVATGPGAVCPNGILDFGEQCDDGNSADTDGCTTCQVDDGYVCPSAGAPCQLIPVCGDGFVGFGEECDDGVNDGGYNECQAECKLGGYCGDGIKQAGETCDDADPDAPASCNGCRIIVVR